MVEKRIKIVKKRGFTLVEILVVLGILGFLFAAIFTVLTNSDRYWRLGRDKLDEQQEARKAIGQISRLLRQSNPDWVIDGTHYAVSISDSNQRINFYQPIFDSDGNIDELKKITFKLNPSDTTQLLKKEGTADSVVVANDIDSISFGGGCAGCGTFTCTSLDVACPVVRVTVNTKKNQIFSLTSLITLRNTNVTLTSDVEVEQPEEGEF